MKGIKMVTTFMRSLEVLHRIKLIPVFLIISPTSIGCLTAAKSTIAAKTSVISGFLKYNIQGQLKYTQGIDKSSLNKEYSILEITGVGDLDSKYYNVLFNLRKFYIARSSNGVCLTSYSSAACKILQSYHFILHQKY